MHPELPQVIILVRRYEYFIPVLSCELHPLPPIENIIACKPCCLLFEPVRAKVNSQWCGNSSLWYSSVCCRQSESVFCLHPRATVHFKRARPKIQNAHKYTNKPRNRHEDKRPTVMWLPRQEAVLCQVCTKLPNLGNITPHLPISLIWELRNLYVKKTHTL